MLLAHRWFPHRHSKMWESDGKQNRHQWVTLGVTSGRQS